jgi:hypothetical protein
MSFGSQAGAPRALALFDSASAMLQALARSLQGRDFRRLGMPWPVEPLALALNALPTTARTRIYALSGAREGISPHRLDSVDAGELYAWAAAQYPHRRYPAVAIGSSNGAAIHLFAALAIPWLPQTLLVLVRRDGIDVDEPKRDLEWVRQTAETLLANNRDIELHHMHDPNQDRLMIRHVAYLRIKRLSLGEAYEHFLLRSLAPGGTILLVECTKRWPTLEVGDRHLFQMGAVGGATPDEYLRGGPRVEEFLRREGSRRRRWDYPEPDGERPEAEWGFQDSLASDVVRFAGRNGFVVKRMVFEHPEDLSPPVADSHRSWYRRLGWDADRLFGSSFMFVDPHVALRSGYVPFWSSFSVEPSAESVERYLKESRPYDEVLMTLFPHGVESIGFAGIDRWRDVLRLSRRRGVLIGVRPDLFPRDFAAFVRFQRSLMRRPYRPRPDPLPLPAWEDHLASEGDRYGVRMETA